MDCVTDEKLIRAVEKHPILYDITNKLYKNNGYRKKLWQDISLEIAIPADVCQKRWKRLRERFCELNKKAKSGSAFKPKTYCSILKTMGFLKPFLNDHPKFMGSSFSINESQTSNSESNSSNISLRSFFAETDPDTLLTLSDDDQSRLLGLDDPVESAAEVVASSTPKKSRLEKNKTTGISDLIQILKEPVKELDAIDYYCMSLANDIKKLDTAEQWRIRMEITKIMCTAKFNANFSL